MSKIKTTKFDGKESANVEKKIIELGKKGKGPSQIGQILKKEHGVPKSKSLGLKIAKILKKNDISYKEDYDNLDAKIEKIKTHAQKNKQDKRSQRELVKLLARTKKLKKYKTGKK